MNYKQALRYLESFIDYEKLSSYSYDRSFNLERIKNFLKLLGNPHLDLKAIHIAGTKGKGSTCAFCAYILRQAGYKVGLYTSPHLKDFRERIRILKPKTQSLKPKTSVFEGMISKKDLTRLVEKLAPSIENFNKISKSGPLTFFEVYTALAFVYFKQEKTDFVVLETGLGGRLDATNVINPMVCAITPISYEHTQLLGKTLKKIATEKAGIIKTGCKIVVSAPQKKEVLEVIKARCRKSGAKLYIVRKDIDCKGLGVKLLGRHQLENAAASVTIIKALRNYGINIKPDVIKGGLYETVWPGRCEIINRRPFVVLDGAQNESSAEVLAKTIRDNFKYKKLILVLGISSDKDIKGICERICPLADKIILTQANSPRAADVNDIGKIIHVTMSHVIKSQVIKTISVKEAKKIAFRLAEKEDLILVTGSLFVVGEFR